MITIFISLAYFAQMAKWTTQTKNEVDIILYEGSSIETN